MLCNSALIVLLLLPTPTIKAALLGEVSDLAKTLLTAQSLPRKVLHLEEPGEAEEDLDEVQGGVIYDVSSTGHVYESTLEARSPATLVDDQTLGSDMGETQVSSGDHKMEIYLRIEGARQYMQEKVMVEDKYEKVRNICQNKHSNCAFWAVLGECENNPAYMLVNCAPVCTSCEKIHVETRCPMDPDAVDAMYPGDLNKMFERILAEPYYQQFQPVVLSRPSYAPGDSAENASYAIGIWMLMFENAITNEEADRLIDLGGIEGYERSSDVGEANADGTYSININSGRTSTNAWCTGACYEDPIAKRVMSRIENITGIPDVNSENLQLLRYEQGQFYQTHNDLIPYQAERPSGVRILTFYFYLNDVEEGGETDFPNVGLRVAPKKGRAVLWPSVFDDRPNVKDVRSDHQAKPVLQGVKYGANAWIHQRDFKGPNSRGC